MLFSLAAIALASTIGYAELHDDMELFALCMSKQKQANTGSNVDYAFDVQNIAVAQASLDRLIGAHTAADIKDCVRLGKCPWAEDMLVTNCGVNRRVAAAYKEHEIISFFMRYSTALLVDYDNTKPPPAMRARQSREPTDLELASAFHGLRDDEKIVLATAIGKIKAYAMTLVMDIYANLPQQLQLKLIASEMQDTGRIDIDATADLVAFLMSTELLSNIRKAIRADSDDVTALEGFSTGDATLDRVWIFMRKNCPSVLSAEEYAVVEKATTEVQPAIRQLCVVVLYILRSH